MMPLHQLPFFFPFWSSDALFFISHHNISEEVVSFSPKLCQKFQRNVLSLLLVWNCQLPQDSCGTHLTVALLSTILHTFASPLSSLSDS